jgi:hypothetical protein
LPRSLAPRRLHRHLGAPTAVGDSDAVEPTRITLVPHTHWDREWYAPFEEFRERLVAMMDTLIDVGSAGFPHFHLDGQTAMVDDYLAVRPEREADIRRLAAEGKLSLGPWVTQMDEFLVSGESHVRNLERGLARAEDLGSQLPIGYLPDQFGHIGQMPQILSSAGIERAVVWRGVPAAIDKTQFWWEAPDGSRVLAEYLAFGYSLGWDLWRYREPEDLASALRRKVEHVAPFLASDRMLITVGSDHSGPDATLPDRLAGAERLLDGCRVSVGSLGDHFEADPPGDLPSWRGELRSSARAHLLPNVTSARAPQKRERGWVEALIERYAEPLSALVPGFEWPEPDVDLIWTLLLWNGAHDSVCGCSHDRVASDVDSRYAEARALAEGLIERAMEALAADVAEAGRCRFNPSPFERDGVPGLGWRVDPGFGTATAHHEGPVSLEVRDGWVHAAGVAFTLADEPDVGDLYNFCPATPGQASAGPAWSAGPGDGEADGRFGPDLTVRIRAGRHDDEPFIRVEGRIENRRPDHRLRLRVHLLEPAAGSLAGSPFELVERSLMSEGGELEAPSPTWPARHVVLAGGVVAYHEGVFEYEVSESELAITLLRCVGTISREHLATRPFAAGPDVPTPQAQMIGSTAFSVALAPDPGRGRLLPDWERFALPLLVAAAPGGGSLPSTGSLLPIEGDAVLSSVRRRNGEVEVRLWNPRSDRPAPVRVGTATLSLGPAAIRSIRAGGGSGLPHVR